MTSFLLFVFKFYEQYDDDEIGALDNAELEGSIQVDSNRLQEVLNDYFKEKAEKYGSSPFNYNLFLPSDDGWRSQSLSLIVLMVVQ